MTEEKFIIYGAEARARPPWPWRQRTLFHLKEQIHGLLDKRQFSHGNSARLDYRHYRGPDCINWGDVAISQSVGAFIAPSAKPSLQYFNWGELNTLPPPCTNTQETIVFAGSGYFFIESNRRLAPRIADDLHILERRGGRALFLGVGINLPSANDQTPPSALHPQDEKLVCRLLARAVGVSVRDTLTQQILQQSTNQPIQLTGDPALHFHSLLQSQIQQGQKTEKRGKPIIGINLAFHGMETTVLLQRNIESYAAVLKKLQDATHCEFRYFVHFGTEHILPKLLAARGIRMKVCAGDTVALARGYAKLDLHIGGMLHSCILATSSGTPCLGLAYDIKHQGFFDLMGLSEHCLSAFHFDPDQLYARALALLADPAPVRAQITARRDALQAATLDFLRHTLPA